MKVRQELNYISMFWNIRKSGLKGKDFENSS